MPIYEYRCGSCSKVFEMTRPMSQASESGTCPECGAKGSRIISGFASTQGYGVKVPAKEPFRGE
jgi:putative FmdB family regulatory protein